MKWNLFISFLITALLSGLVSFTINKLYQQELSSLVLVPLIFVIVLLLFYVNERIKQIVAPNAMKVLRPILNSCARDAFEITTIHDFLIETSEDSLAAGDEVLILTNSLDAYDTTAPAVRVIARNLKDGVKYVYFLEVDEYPALLDEIDRFVGLLLREPTGLAPNLLGQHLIFYSVVEECIHNFAIVKVRGNVRGYWYITTPSNTDPKERQLVILEMRRDHRDNLLKLFQRLSKSKRIFTMERDVRDHRFALAETSARVAPQKIFPSIML
jgi:hypothetical protein